MIELQAPPGGKLTEDHVVYHGQVHLYSWSDTSRSGMRITFQLPDRDHLNSFESKNMVKRGVRRQLGDIYGISVFDMRRRKIGTFEVWFKGMYWNNDKGATIQFQLAEKDDFERFKHYGTLDGGQDGSSAMMITLVQLDDHGNIINQAQRKRAEGEKPKGGPNSKEAGILCNDEHFILWMARQYAEEFEKGTDVASLVRSLCGVKSRAELDHNPEAYKRFCELRNQYMDESQ